MIKEDWELQAWGKELVKDKDTGGVGLLVSVSKHSGLLLVIIY